MDTITIHPTMNEYELVSAIYPEDGLLALVRLPRGTNLKDFKNLLNRLNNNTVALAPDPDRSGPSHPGIMNVSPPMAPRVSSIPAPRPYIYNQAPTAPTLAQAAPPAQAPAQPPAPAVVPPTKEDMINFINKNRQSLDLVSMLQTKFGSFPTLQPVLDVFLAKINVDLYGNTEDDREMNGFIVEDALNYI